MQKMTESRGGTDSNPDGEPDMREDLESGYYARQAIACVVAEGPEGGMVLMAGTPSLAAAIQWARHIFHPWGEQKSELGGR